METWGLTNRFTQAPSSPQTSLNRPSVVPRDMNDSKLSKMDATTIVEHEMQQVERANSTGRPPVVFIHGLWLLPSSWDRWAKVFEDAGYATLTNQSAKWPNTSNRSSVDWRKSQHSSAIPSEDSSPRF